jgi:hypothetical protein
MTLNDIRTAAAAYLHRTVLDFTINGVDLSLFALNQVRQAAELQNDFNFTRKLVKLDVDGSIGGSLSDAVDYYSLAPAEVKTIIDVGQFDGDGNLRPVEWTTVAAGLDRQRSESPQYLFRYPTDGQASFAGGMPRFVFSGDMVYLFPKRPNEATLIPIGLEAYTFTQDWVEADLNTRAEPWGTKGSQYLLWGLVIHLNQVFKDFVFRQEGNLPPPQTLADQGLSSLITWDIYKYEQFRRHNR